MNEQEQIPTPRKSGSWMHVRVEIDPEIVESCISSASASRDFGIGYWGESKTSPRGSIYVRESMHALGRKDSPGPWRLLTKQRIRYGLGRLAATAPQAFARFLSGECDATDGDLLIQWAVLGEVKYG